MKIEVVTEASLSINHLSFLTSDCRLAGRTLDRCRAIHLAINDRRVQAKVNAPDGCHRWTRYVSLIVDQDHPLDLTEIRFFSQGARMSVHVVCITISSTVFQLRNSCRRGRRHESRLLHFDGRAIFQAKARVCRDFYCVWKWIGHRGDVDIHQECNRSHRMEVCGANKRP